MRERTPSRSEWRSEIRTAITQKAYATVSRNINAFNENGVFERDRWSFAGASIDLRVGGQYRLGMTDPAGTTHVAVGVYREVQRPVRLVFTWDWENPANRVGETLVSVEFKALGEKRTEIVLTHEGFADSTRMGRHEQGWTELLRLLEGFIVGHS